MKSVDIQEFRDHATQYLEGERVLAVERDGELIGYYVPAGASRRERNGKPINSNIPTGANRRERSLQTVERLQQIVQRVLDETGMTEEELSQFFDLSQPVPDLQPLEPEMSDIRAPSN